MKRLFVILLIALAGFAGWWAARYFPHHTHASAEPSAGEPLYYQSPMHPWVTSPKPGRCTVCGMELVPVFAGSKPAGASNPDLVLLPGDSPRVSGIAATEVKRQPLERTLRVAGVISENETRHRILSAYVDGRIERLAVNFVGAEVAEGELLATFYSRPLLSAIGEHQLLGQSGTPDTRRASARRLRQFGLTQAQIEAIERGEGGDALAVDIVSPMAGTVVERKAYEGQYVKEGDSLFEIADFSTMWFVFYAYEQDLPWLKVGQNVEVTAAAHPGKTWPATIQFIDPNLDIKTRSARVRAEIGNHDRLLRNGLYAQAAVDVGAPDVLAVPRSAVLWPGDQPRVFVEKDAGAYEKRGVNLGRAGDSLWEVLEGLQEGDRVVITGNVLIDGQAQLTNLAAPVEAAGTSPPVDAGAPPPTLTDAQKSSLGTYARAAAAVGAALAADDLAAFNAAVEQLPPKPAEITKPPPTTAADLKSARQAFLPWIDQLAQLAPQLRQTAPELRVFRCPMTDQLWQGSPATARWVQVSAPLRNPYFGKVMLECGEEIKP
jgi:Cu(I)/Ag(I) efflux system membrane fusion protein